MYIIMKACYFLQDLDDRKERAMSEFCKLLEDKNFLLTFIRVLDEPRSAPVPVIRER